jgi:exosortase
MARLHWPAAFTQTRVAFALKIVTLLAVTVTLFYQDFVLIFSDALQNETTSYVLAVPFILAYLVYRKRNMLRTVMPLTGEHQPRNTRHLGSLSGLLLAATAVLLYWSGSYAVNPLEYHMFALPLFTAGLILILFNPQTLRQLAFPVIFLFFLMPPPSEILYATGSTLQVISAHASNAIINTFNIPSTLTMDSGNPLITLTTPDGTQLPFLVGITCSGIYSLIGFTVFAVTIAYVIRDKPWKKAALIIVGIPLVYLLNIFRITTMLFIGYNLGEDLALQTFHLLGGFVLIFIGTLILLLVSEKAFKTKIFSKPAVKCVQCNPEPQLGRNYCSGCGRIFSSPAFKLHKTDIVKLAAIVLIVGFLVTIQPPSLALIQGPQTVNINAPFGQQYNSTQLLPQIDNYTLIFLYDDQQARTLGQDAAPVYWYTPLNESMEPINVQLSIASSMSFLHGWYYCKITQPQLEGLEPTVSQIDFESIPLTQNPQPIGQYFVFQDTYTGELWAVLYWFTSANFVVTNSTTTTQQKQIEISLIAYPSSIDEARSETLKNQLVTLATTIENYWQPLQTWSETTLLISQNGITLSTATSAALVATLIYYTAETRRRRKTNLKAASKLTSLSTEIVRAVQKTKKPATLENLASTLQKNTGQTIASEQLEQRLGELESAGIIKSQIYSQNDMPVQTWKT